MIFSEWIETAGKESLYLELGMEPQSGSSDVKGKWI